jgi:hypothetical protein
VEGDARIKGVLLEMSLVLVFQVTLVMRTLIHTITTAEALGYGAPFMNWNLKGGVLR